MQISKLFTKNIMPIPFLLALLLSSAAYSAEPAKTSENTPSQPMPSLAEALNNAMPAVVNVTVLGEVPAKYLQKPDAPKQFQEMGSGVIINAKKGYIVTNAHVIKNGKVTTIMLKDGRRFKAKVLGTDAPSDLAILQINADNLTQIKISNSDTLRVGDFVAAIGTPFGLHQTVTSGVVSALHRSDLGIEGYENFIQTDASINPGNSGGALVNLKGELVGINTALIGPIGGNVGIGLSIPSNMVMQIANQLIKGGTVSRGVVGVMVQNLTPELADALELSGKKGGLVTNVVPGSPADKAGLQVQDIIEKINNITIENGTQVRNIIGLLPVNTKLTIYVHRKDKPITLQATIADPKAYKAATEPASASLFDGVRLTTYDELTPGFGIVKGVAVLDVDEMSDAWISNLRPSDVILEANGQKVSNLDQLMEVVKKQESSKSLLLKIGRGQGIIFIVAQAYS
ncbi:MAG: degP [Gammaproteobacteria bacterium]|nr:degP [Gammaproteobacteria bacterium]